MKKLFFRLSSIIAIFAFSSSMAYGQFYYSYLPKKLHPHQLFSITIASTNQNTQPVLPSFEFDATTTLQQLSDTPIVAKSGKDYFYTFYFKVLNNSSVTIPRVVIVANNEAFSLDASRISVVPLPKRDDFSGVLATDMKIKTYQVSQYDEHKNLVTISIEAFEANLEDISLAQLSEEGIEEIRRNGAKVEGEYFGLIDNQKHTLVFTYYNTIQQNYIAFEIPLHIKDASAAGQLELNPKDDSFEMVKRYTFMVLTFLFLGLFLIKKDFFYFFLGIVSLVMLITFYTPHEKICVAKGATVYILPTPTSTISATIPKDFQTMLLETRGDFIKIEYNSQSIGWVHRENLCKN